MKLVGGNASAKIAGADELPGKSNYFIGNDPSQWRTNVSNYSKVEYRDVYPGIDLVYHGNQRQLEYDFVLAPGADPKRIELVFEGTRSLSLDKQGNLILATADGDLVQHKPAVYQEADGKRTEVEGSYVLRGRNRAGFRVASYDAHQPLVIDPVLSYSTYLGGNGNDIGYGIAVDSAGNAYVTGVTSSTNFPGASASTIQPAGAGSNDVFVIKLNAAGSALVYSTYLGGSGTDTGYAIAVDSDGNAYVTGETDSSTVTNGFIPFPMVGAFQARYAGGGDAFVTKINASGNALVYSSYLGGSGTERGYGIAVDGSGNAYVTGHTNSSRGIVPSPNDFPTVAPFQSQNGSPGTYDAFVTKINAAGSALVYSTYLGGNGSEYSTDGGAITVDSDGNAYVGGTTASTNFPGASTSTIQPTNGGGFNDGFVVKFNAAGSALLYSTYLGGSGYDAVYGIAIDTARNAYVVGYTDSPNFPTASPLQASRNGYGNDAFVSKINAAGSALVYSTYLGGSGSDVAYAVAVDSGGNAYVSGFTGSSNFPTEAPLQTVAGSGDAFISKLNAAGSALVFSTYLGAQSGTEAAYGIALDSAGNAYVTGQTNSSNFPTAGPFQATLGGSMDAFVAKYLFPPSAATLISPSGAIGTSTPTYMWNAVAGVTYYQLWVNDSTASGKIQTWYTAAQAGCAAGTGVCSVTPSTPLAGGGGGWWIVTWNSAGYGPWSSAMIFNVSAGGVPGAATLISPSGTITTTTPAYNWNAVAGATWYYLWIGDSSANPKIQVWITSSSAGCSSGAGTCSYTPSTALASGSAMWYIETWNSAGYGPWSSVMTFNVSAGGVPGAATLISPSGTITTTTPAYNWNAVAGVTYYQLWVNDSSSSASSKIVVWITSAAAGCSSGAGTCSYTPSTALASGSATWWIQTYNPAGYGAWSSGMAFYVSAGGVPGAATLISPSGTIGTSTPAYNWNAVAGATWYYLWVTDSSANPKILVWITSAAAGCSSGAGTCSYIPSTALASGSAMWWIETYNSAGYGPWSSGMTFNVP
jgi:hypothetical protein